MFWIRFIQNFLCCHLWVVLLAKTITIPGAKALGGPIQNPEINLIPDLNSNPSSHVNVQSIISSNFEADQVQTQVNLLNDKGSAKVGSLLESPSSKDMVVSDVDPSLSVEEDPEDTDPTYSWVIAVVLCVLAALISNFGTNLQKLAWNKKKQKKEEVDTLGGLDSTIESNDGDLNRIYADLDEEVNEDHLHFRSDPNDVEGGRITDLQRINDNESAGDEEYAKNSPQVKLFRLYWLLGFACIVFGSLFDFAALAFGAQSVVAPLGSLTLVANIGFAQLMHGEKLTKNDLWATGIIIIGCVFSVAFATHKDEIADIDELLGLYHTSSFTLYAMTILLIIFVSVIFIRYMERILVVYGPRSRRYARISRYHRFSHAALSGVVGAQSVLFAKSLDELLVASFAGSRFFLTYIGTYLIAGAMLASISLQIYWLNCALARWDALYVIPIFQSNWIVFSVIGGGVFYGEFSGFSFGQAFAFLLGVTLTVVGVYFLSQRDVADDTKQTLVSAGENSSATAAAAAAAAERYSSNGYGSLTLDQPLLKHISDEFGILGKSKKPSFEYEVTVKGEKLGISIEPFTIPSSHSRMFTAGEKRDIKVWRVKRKPVVDNDSGLSPYSEVDVGHIIVAVNGVSVLGPKSNLGTVLKEIKTLPRPIVIRFRAMSGVTSVKSNVQGKGREMKDATSDSYSDTAVLPKFDDQSAKRVHRKMQGTTLNPLLDIIHTWDNAGPSAFEEHVNEEISRRRKSRANSAEPDLSKIENIESYGYGLGDTATAAGGATRSGRVRSYGSSEELPKIDQIIDSVAGISADDAEINQSLLSGYDSDSDDGVGDDDPLNETKHRISGF